MQMHRPNLAMDAPPTEIKVGGCFYPINTDYRIWIDVLDNLCDMYTDIDTADDLKHNAEIMRSVQVAVFGGVLVDEEMQDVLRAIVDFSHGYPDFARQHGEHDETNEDEADVFSFDYDINAIIIAIRNQSGIDLSYRRKEPFHWWEFLLEFRTLNSEHYITKLMQARGYKGDDKEMLREKRRVQLPHRITADEQRELDAFDAVFGD